MIIQFARCDKKTRDTCKSDEEFKDWIQDKDIIIVENTWTFRQY